MSGDAADDAVKVEEPDNDFGAFGDDPDAGAAGNEDNDNGDDGDGDDDGFGDFDDFGDNDKA